VRYLKSFGSAISQAVAVLVKRSRLAAGLTQRQLAARIGWHDAKIVLIEKGQQQVRVAEFVALFEELGLDPPAALRQAMKMRTQGNLRLKKPLP
jgi:transcriptional regulator with XRE-family HTH domain